METENRVQEALAEQGASNNGAQLDAAQTLHLPGDVVASRNVFQRKVERKARALKKLEEAAQLELESVNDELRAAHEELQDHRDDEFLRTGTDPAEAPYSSRKPEYIQRERQLAREVERSARIVTKQAREQDQLLEATKEYVEFSAIVEEYSSWLDDVYAFYGTFENRVNWDEGTYTKYMDSSTIPPELLDR